MMDRTHTPKTHTPMAHTRKENLNVENMIEIGTLVVHPSDRARGIGTVTRVTRDAVYVEFADNVARGDVASYDHGRVRPATSEELLVAQLARHRTARRSTRRSR